MKALWAFILYVCLVNCALAQDITNHSVPIGGGPGAVGWKEAGPCAAGQALVWSNVSTDPQCTSVSGSGSTPGGSNLNIQYNNAGTFGGLTDTQVTARINLATTALKGALPAWPNNTTTFFRGDGTYAALPAPPSSLPAGYVIPSVVADAQLLTNGSMTNGGTTLTSATNPFVVGDVSKVIQCGGTGAAGVLSSGAITAFNSAGSVAVSFTAGATIVASAVCQWGTDNTTVINSAIQGLTAGGTVLLPVGNIMVSSINMTHTTATNLVGAGCGIGGDHGTVLIGTTASNNRAIIDLVGAQSPGLDCLQVHTSSSPVAPGGGILIANSSISSTTLVSINRVFVSGVFQNYAVLLYGAQDSVIRFSQFWNISKSWYGQSGSEIPLQLAADNGSAMGSSYVTIATGAQACGNVSLYNLEAHDHKPAGGATSGAAMRIRGCGGITVYGGLFDSSTSALGVITFDASTAAVSPFRITLISPVMYTENGTNAANCLDAATGVVNTVTILNPSYTCTTTRVGTFNYVGFSTP